MKPCVPRLALLLACILALPVHAQQMKPGLWEFKSTTSSPDPLIAQSMAAAQAMIAQMAPEQRKMAEEAMAKQGIKLGAAGGAMSMQVCMTPEMVAKYDVPIMSEGDCTSKTSKSGGNTIKYSFQCTKPQARGDGVATFSSDKAFTSTMTVTSNTAAKSGKG